MLKTELISHVASEAGISKKQAETAVNAFLSGVKSALAKGEKVLLVGFGTFLVRRRAARKGRNPQTGAEITIPEMAVPAFKAGRDLKEAVR
jgi:DNA-binding protein HU-beta